MKSCKLTILFIYSGFNQLHRAFFFSLSTGVWVSVLFFGYLSNGKSLCNFICRSPSSKSIFMARIFEYYKCSIFLTFGIFGCCRPLLCLLFFEQNPTQFDSRSTKWPRWNKFHSPKSLKFIHILAWTHLQYLYDWNKTRQDIFYIVCENCG